MLHWAVSLCLLLHCCTCHCATVSFILQFLSSRFWLAFFMPLIHVFGSCLSAIGSRFRFLFGCHWFTLTGTSWFSPIFFCSHYLCSFIHSIFAFIGFGRFYLGPFAFTDFTRCLQEVCFLIFDMLYYLYACTAFCMLV